MPHYKVYILSSYGAVHIGLNAGETVTTWNAASSQPEHDREIWRRNVASPLLKYDIVLGARKPGLYEAVSVMGLMFW